MGLEMDNRNRLGYPSHTRKNQQNPSTTSQGVSDSDTSSSRLFLWCNFFGKFEVVYDDEVLILPNSTKSLAILRYLLASPKRPVSRDFLIDWLWPESDLVKGKYSVNSAVCVLRKLFSSVYPTLAPTDCILLEQDYYRLSPNICVTSDKDEFDAHYKRGRQLERAEWASEAIAEYDEAVALYKGEFLSEDLYEEWTLIERQRLDSVYIDILERIAAYHKVNCNYRECIETYYKILAKEPCHESSHRFLMDCYAQLGLRAQASRQFKLCERILRRRYGVAPSLDIKTLHEQLRE